MSMEQKEFYTYLHCKPSGVPFYVGKGCGDRCYNFNTRNNHHKNIVKKYGKENILVYIFNCESEEQAFSDEVQQIKQLRKELHKLANQTDGGDGHSGKGRKHKPLSEEAKIHISLGMMGKKRKPFSEETKIRMSISASKRIASDITCYSISKGLMNRELSEIHKLRISQSNKINRLNKI